MNYPDLIPGADGPSEYARAAMTAAWAQLREILASPCATLDELKDTALCVQRLSSAYSATLTAEHKRAPDDATAKPNANLPPSALDEIEAKLHLL